MPRRVDRVRKPTPLDLNSLTAAARGAVIRSGDMMIEITHQLARPGQLPPPHPPLHPPPPFERPS